jgi:predicted TPR repeat methyltransferase
MSNAPATPSTFQLAMQHHQAGRLREAEALYRRILDQSPRDANALHMLGILASQVGRNDLAAGLLEQTLAILPGAAIVYSELGEFYRRLNRLEDAAAACRRAIALQPDLFDAHYNLAVVLQQQKKLDLAIASYKAALALDARSAAAHYNLANALKDQHQLDAALAAYQSALALNPNYAEAHGNLGLILHEKGDLAAAVESFQRVIALRPDDAVAHNSLGNSLHAQRLFDEALVAYQRAIVLNHDYAAAHNNMGKLLFDTDHVAESLPHYQRAIALAPDRPEAYKNLGMALEKLHRETEAVAMYMEALKRGEPGSDARYHMAALTGTEAPPIAPASHIIKVFDELAETFDHHLVDKLDYKTPQLLHRTIMAAAAAHSLPPRFNDILDLGCGTGLCAALFKPLCQTLTGVDLSPAMIQKARDRQLYHHLHTGELTAFLLDHQSSFDLAFAADVLVYIGDLAPVFAAAAKSLRPAGLFAFSVEAAGGPCPAGYELLRTRRYAHTRAYLRAKAREHHFTELALEPATLRKERGKPVAGLIAVFASPKEANGNGTV